MPDQNAPPRLTDRDALRRNRARAFATGAPAMFLQREAATEIEERLEAVNRSFTAPAIVSGFPQFWAARWPGARCVPDEAILDLQTGAHDLVLHVLALHWAEDPVGQLVQARHALRPDGLFLGLTFGGRTLHELRAALAAAEAELSGGLSPRVLPMADIADLGALLQRAGLAMPVADSLSRTVSYASALHLMQDLRAMGEASALVGRPRRPTPRGVLLRAAEVYAAAHAQVDGRVPATFEIIALTGWAPAASQPKPLRPGSAAARLADALGAAEARLPRDQAAPQARDDAAD